MTLAPERLAGSALFAKLSSAADDWPRPFDSHLIGIDPDGRVHVSERLLMLHDGPLLEQSLKAIAGTQIRPPRRHVDCPDRERLAARFEQLKGGA